MVSAQGVDKAAGFGFAEQLDAIASATAVIVEHLESAGPKAAVPTCPDWTLRDLVAHVGMVHRWATTIVANGITQRPDITVEPAPADGLADWLVDGSDRLVETIAQAPDDLQSLVIFKTGLSPKEFWARRQAHESTIHSVDAQSARRGRIPTTKEADIRQELAVDGLDELLTGFVPRRNSELRSEEPLTFVVAPTDIDRAWTVLLSADPPVTSRGGMAGGDADAVLTGTAASLYLGLHNRGDEIAVTGEPELLGVWRDKVRIRWS
ncbi:MAG: maleylpyruvate isomerase family mycothiol-dependent enzyme [Actinomycetota bacterium]|nr:maleylpyruvate isomerase family mycothiol-dependent enzyme [Actinomycetota bacterium]